MELYGNFTNYDPADTCLIETEHIAAFISKFEHRLSVVSTVLTVSDLKLLMYKAEIEYIYVICQLGGPYGEKL